MFICLLTLSLSRQRYSQSATNNEVGYVIAKPNVNIRAKPSKSSTLLGRVDYGNTVDIVSSYDDDWYEINYNGQTAYVMKQFISLEAPTPEPEPSPSTGTKVIKCSEPVRFWTGEGTGTCIGRLSSGTGIDVVGQSGKYVEFQLSSSTAFVHQSYVTDGSGSVNPKDCTGSGLVDYATSKLGCPYEYGAHGPNSFDCAGLIHWCYMNYGIFLGYGTNIQMERGRKISDDDKIPGDALYISHHKEDDGKSDHVGMFIGDGQMIHAPCTGEVVKKASIEGRKIVGIRRYY